MVIPLVAAFAAGAGGVAALGAAAAIGGTMGAIATVAAYATIAGAVLTGVGAITGSRDLMKIGAVLSIGGGLTSVGVGMASAGSAAAEGAGEASAAASAANAEGAYPAAITGEATPMPVPSPQVPEISPTPGPQASPFASPDAPGTAALNAEPGSKTSIFDAAKATDAGSGGNLGPDYGGGASGPGGPGTSMTSNPAGSVMDKVNAAAQQQNGSDVASWWEKAKNAGGAVSKFINDNPALVKIGGDMLSSAFGPQAEMLDWQKSIYNRNRANLNSPVPLTYKRSS